MPFSIEYATNQVKQNINSGSFLYIITIVITICLVKFLAFSFIFPYVLSMFPAKQGMLDANSQPESSTKQGKDPYSDPDSNPEPIKDIVMGNNEDSDDSDSDSYSNPELNKDEYPYIVSTNWPREYFKGHGGLSYTKFDINATYIEPAVKQVILGTSVKDIFANSLSAIDISKLENRTDLKFNPYEKTWKNYKSMF